MSDENKEINPDAQTTSEPSDSPASERLEPRDDIKLDPKLAVSQEDVSSNAASTDRDPESTVREAALPTEAVPEFTTKEAAVPTETAPESAVKEAAEISEAVPEATVKEVPPSPDKTPGSEDAEAKAKAVEEARAARASAREKKEQEDSAGEEAVPKEPSPNQPRLDRIVHILKSIVHLGAVEDAFINERDHHLPTLTIRNSDWFACARLLKEHDELKLNYLRNVSGIDQETHLEVAYYLLSLSTKHEYCFKVKTDREAASIPSVTPIWQTANWNEREIYDLLGIDFPGHPDLRRIMMPDDWVGHPLRKDYESIDPEV